MVPLAQQKGCLRTVIQRIRIVLRGAVQGVGFRPFVYTLASEMMLPGWVLNSPIHVTDENQSALQFVHNGQTNILMLDGVVKSLNKSFPLNIKMNDNIP